MLASAHPDTADGRWWSASGLPRWLADLIRSEARTIRPATTLPPGTWAPETWLDEQGLGFDSLERLQLAAALSEALHMHESGIADFLLAKRSFGEWCDVATQSLNEYSAKLTFRTSGSTGQPRPIVHRLSDLHDEIDALLPLLFKDTTRVLSAVPCHHIYGFLFTVLLPQKLSEIPVLDIAGLSPGSLVGLLRPGDLIVGHPEFWAAAARAIPFGWRSGVTGLTSTAPCPAETAAKLEQAGLSRLVEIHGSSETGGIGWRTDPAANYALMPQWQRNQDGGLRRNGVVFAAPDRLEWVASRRYRINGRIDGAVQVGGTNVFPAHVEAVLSSHPGVAAASVRLMAATEGRRLKAFIVPRGPAAETASLQAALETFAALNLSTPERPRAYTFGAELPRGALGKSADWPLAPPE